jgi:hypothetical protein
MTSLRTFQLEIDEIQNREVAKQRIQALADREKEKENKKPQSKVKNVKEDENDSSGNGEAVPAEMGEVDEEIQVSNFDYRVSLIKRSYNMFRYYCCPGRPLIMTRRETLLPHYSLNTTGNMLYGSDSIPQG